MVVALICAPILALPFQGPSSLVNVVRFSGDGEKIWDGLVLGQ